MNSKRGWMVLWGAVSALWIAYWLVLTLSMGGQTMQEMIASMDGTILLSGLFLSLPLCLYGGGSLVAWLIRQVKGSK